MYLSYCYCWERAVTKTRIVDILEVRTWCIMNRQKIVNVLIGISINVVQQVKSSYVQVRDTVNSDWNYGRLI